MSAVKQQSNNYHPARGKNVTAGYTAEQHAEAKRASKARKRANRGHKNRGADNEVGYLAGLKADKVYGFALALMDRLDSPMSSSSVKANFQLRAALVAYAEEFAVNPQTFIPWQVRHDNAMKLALQKIDDDHLQSYAVRQFKLALLYVKLNYRP